MNTPKSYQFRDFDRVRYVGHNPLFKDRDGFVYLDSLEDSFIFIARGELHTDNPTRISTARVAAYKKLRVKVPVNLELCK